MRGLHRRIQRRAIWIGTLVTVWPNGIWSNSACGRTEWTPSHYPRSNRWRPNHETFLYPFLPAHVSRPKELKKLYLIHLPPNKVLSVPKNMKLLAVPLFELYDNTARYGPQLSAIPHYLSKYRFEFVDEDGNLSSVMPGGGPIPGPGGFKVDMKQEENGDLKIENGH